MFMVLEVIMGGFHSPFLRHITYQVQAIPSYLMIGKALVVDKMS